MNLLLPCSPSHLCNDSILSFLLSLSQPKLQYPHRWPHTSAMWNSSAERSSKQYFFFFPPSQLSDQTHKRYSSVCTHKATTWKAGGTWKGQEGHRLCYTYTLSKSGPSMYNQFKTARLEERFLLMPPGKHQKMLLGTIPADTAIVTASKAKKKYCCLLLGVF